MDLAGEDLAGPRRSWRAGFTRWAAALPCRNSNMLNYGIGATNRPYYPYGDSILAGFLQPRSPSKIHEFVLGEHAVEHAVAVQLKGPWARGLAGPRGQDP